MTLPASENAPDARFGGEGVGVPYGSRTRVAAVKEKRPFVIQRNLAAWIALYRTSRTHGNAYWTFNGRALVIWESSYIFEYLSDCAAAFGTRKQMLITSTKAMILIIFSLVLSLVAALIAKYPFVVAAARSPL
jgi:hypothetical protein